MRIGKTHKEQKTFEAKLPTTQMLKDKSGKNQY